MFKTKHTKMAFFTAGILCCAVLTGLVNSVKAGREDQAEPVPQDMNDRIIADTAKCVQAGLEPEIEQPYRMLPGSDSFIIVCKPPGGKESNLDRMLRQMGLPERGPVKKQTPSNPDSFETKSKVTQ